MIPRVSPFNDNNEDKFKDEVIQYSAGGLRDFTRIAASDPLMWKDISATNMKNILKSLDVLSNEFKLVRSMINKKNFKSLHRYFKNIKDKLS